MKTLATEFTKQGWTFRQLDRAGRIALFERSRMPNAKGKHWEVVRIREHGEFVLGGNTIEAGEAYPSSSTWGSDGFTYTDFNDAKAKFAALVEREDSK